MQGDYDNDISAGSIIKWVLIGIVVLFGMWGCSIVTGIISLPFHAASNVVQTAHGVIDRTMNADNAIMNYNWFHDASATLDNYPAKITNADKLAQWAQLHAPDRAMARQTELTGLEQTCLGLVGDYNAKASTLTAGFFRNPEKWLPVAAAPWQPLPPSYSTTQCDPPPAK